MANDKRMNVENALMRTWLRISYFITITILFNLGFYRNQWNVIAMDDVQYRRNVSETFVMGRLVKSRQDGILSAGGLLGIGDVTEMNFNNTTIKNQQRKYNKGTGFSSFWTYKSQPGFQGIAYGLVDFLTGFAPSTNLFLFRFLISFALALTMAGICMWFLLECGWLSSMSVVIFTLVSKWLALLGGNLFWSLWSFYLPLLALSFLLRRNNGRSGYVLTFRFVVIVFFLSLIKILFSGFEFITTSLLMMTVPLVYYAVLNSWTWKATVRGFVNMGIGLAVSVMAGLIILGFQIKMDVGSYTGALDHIVYSWRNRTYGHDALTAGVSTSLAGSVEQTVEVIGTYLNGYAFSLSARYQVVSAFLRDLLDGRYLYLVILFAGVTGLFVAMHARAGTANEHRTGLALIAASWYSILAPLSWLVIFRDHARGHTLLDFIVWQMPFTLYGFALVGFSLSSWSKLKYLVPRNKVQYHRAAYQRESSNQMEITLRHQRRILFLATPLKQVKRNYLFDLLDMLAGKDFEAVDPPVLMVDPNSGETP